MLTRQYGRIINIASVAGLQGLVDELYGVISPEVSRKIAEMLK